MLLSLPKAEQKIFDARPQPLPELEETLQREWYGHGDHHVQDYISGAHRVDDPNLHTAGEISPNRQVIANVEKDVRGLVSNGKGVHGEQINI